MGNNAYTRSFSYGSPVDYQGNLYPSTMMDIEDDKGNTASRRVFAGANGRYYSLNDDGYAVPVILQNNLDEVVVKPNMENLLTKQFNDYLTQSSDNTQMLNVPHRDYNPHLRYGAIRGAESNALWEREHPNATAWRNAAELIPFAVASAPFTLGVGDTLAATSAGEAIGNGFGLVADAASNSTWLPWVNAGLSSVFSANGLQDVQNGRFTPQTAMDLMPLAQLGKPMYEAGAHLARNINDYNNLRNFIDRYGYTEYKPKIGLIFDDAKLDKLTNQLVKQHNRFTRGISVAEARRYYGFPEEWTDEQVAEYCLTHPHIPRTHNAGGNPEQNPVLYTSNSLDLSRQYTDEDGYIGILQRPITYDSDRSKMLKMNDFRLKALPDELNNNLNPSVTTDEPYIFNGKIPKGVRERNKVNGGIAYKRRGRVIRTYSPVPPTFLDAQANAGSYMFPTQRPYSPNFRHYLFYGDPDEQILRLEKLIKYTKPKGSPSVDYKPYSVGFSKKKALGGII